MLGQRVEFDERVLVEQRVDALAGGQLALGVHLLDGGLTDRMQRLFGRLRSSASLPAVVWMSMVCSAAGSAVWSVTLVMGVDVTGGG